MNTHRLNPSLLEGSEGVQEIQRAIYLIDEILLDLQGFVSINEFICKRNFERFIEQSDGEWRTAPEE